MGRTVRPRVACLAVLGIALGACMGIVGDSDKLGSPGRIKDVRTAAESYSSNLRWGNYDAAAEFVHPDERKAFRRLLREIGDDLRFTSFEIEQVEFADSIAEAEAMVSFSLYRVPRVDEETMFDYQTWRWDPMRSRWFLSPDLALYSGRTDGGAATRAEPGSARR
jgi:hypothetical protein